MQRPDNSGCPAGDKQTPPELDLHPILGNCAAHKTDAVKRWLARHPRFHVH